MLPDPEQLDPCADEQICWDTSLFVSACGYAAHEEDFSSGNYNVHRYASRLWGGTETTITVANENGAWAPAIIVAKLDGEVIYDGEIGLVSQTLTAEMLSDGRDGGAAQVRIASEIDTDVDVFVTSWETRDSSFSAPITTDAIYLIDIDNDCDPGAPIDATAPAGALAGEVGGNVGDNSITLGTAAWGAPVRFDIPASTHVGFELTFSPASAAVDMQVLRWNGSQAVEMTVTNGGSGERVLAVLDEHADRTYWVRARGSATGSLAATFTPFDEGPQCQDDCDRLLQLPLPNDPITQGYGMAGYVVYRYQFGRRDVLMSVRHAGRVVAAAGGQPFTIQDLSKGDGTRPPGHASHTDGKDVDISVYDSSGNAVWYPLCDEVNNECIPGTDHGMHYEWMARKIAPMLESNRVTHIFLDSEFHDQLFTIASDLAMAGEINNALVPYMADVVSHWPNHNNHIHVRYDTSDY